MASPSAPTPRLPVGGVTPEALRPPPRTATPMETPRWRAVVRIAWPVVLTNLLHSAALTVDLAFVGVLGAVSLAAAGFATQVFMLALAVATGLAAAATAIVARAFGAGDRDAADRATWHVLAASLAIGLTLMLVLVAAAAPFVLLVGADAEVAEPAIGFLVLLAAGLPASAVISGLAGAFQGAGDTRPALLVGLVVNGLNVVLDAVLIFGLAGAPRMGLAGAAVATSISFVAGAVLFLFILRWGRRPLRLRAQRLQLARVASLFRVGAPAGIEALVLSVGFTAYLLLILSYGAPALAAHSIGLRVQSFAFLPGFGLAAAAAALTGQALGAGDPQRAESDGWLATRLGLVLMVGASIPLMIFARPIAGVFTRDPEALRLGALWISAIVLAMPAIAMHFTVAGALRGAGDTRWPLLVSFGGLWLVRLPLAWLLAGPFGLGMIGVWAAYIVEYNARALVTVWRFRSGRWKTIRLD